MIIASFSVVSYFLLPACGSVKDRLILLFIIIISLIITGESRMVDLDHVCPDN